MLVPSQVLPAGADPWEHPKPWYEKMNKPLSAIGRNINQIAKRVYAEGPTYQADMEEIQERLDQIWQLQRRILSSQP